MSLNSFSQWATGARDRHAAASFLSTLMASCRSLSSGVMRRRQFRQDVLHVRDLPDHLLKDIGIHRGNIVAAVYGGRGRA
ncbi:MAG: DUF1127 domain-containing protein [Rhizobiales bacterium]|nr:DUF1127 domain-containing protein [Hyphomicrobiales bacterium]